MAGGNQTLALIALVAVAAKGMELIQCGSNEGNMGAVGGTGGGIVMIASRSLDTTQGTISSSGTPGASVTINCPEPRWRWRSRWLHPALVSSCKSGVLQGQRAMGASGGAVRARAVMI